MVKEVPGVSRVVNEIRVLLPVSANDERLRREVYNVIYGSNSPLFRYGIGSRQAIQIIVDGGRPRSKEWLILRPIRSRLTFARGECRDFLQLTMS